MEYIRNEEGKIKLMFINGGYQLFPNNEDLQYIYVTDEELEKINNGEYLLWNNELIYEPNYEIKYKKLNIEMKQNDWKQLRAYRHLILNGEITNEDKKILEWFETKSQELEKYKEEINKLKNNY